MIEENRKRAQERKRKREAEQQLSSTAQKEPTSQRVSIAEDDQKLIEAQQAVKRLQKEMGFAIGYSGNDEEVIDINEEDLEDEIDEMEE